MKKWFKNLLIILAAVILFNKEISAQSTIIIDNSNYKTWQAYGNTCAGCGSFFVMVSNNPVPINGYYYYDIYFWSNSFYQNGYASNTYIKQINIYATGPNGVDNLVLKFPYAVVPPKSNVFNGYFYVGYIYSFSAMQKIKISWVSASAW